jgi:hypothetical protein
MKLQSHPLYNKLILPFSLSVFCFTPSFSLPIFEKGGNNDLPFHSAGTVTHYRPEKVALSAIDLRPHHANSAIRWKKIRRRVK